MSDFDFSDIKSGALFEVGYQFGTSFGDNIFYFLIKDNLGACTFSVGPDIESEGKQDKEDVGK